jgi:hypothetical protein
MEEVRSNATPPAPKFLPACGDAGHTGNNATPGCRYRYLPRGDGAGRTDRAGQAPM